MTDSLFDKEDHSQLDPNEKYFDKFVGEGKKWKDNETLVRAKLDSDSYVKTLEARLDEMREDLTRSRENETAGQNLKELLDQMKLQQELTSRNTPPNEDSGTPTKFDPKELDSLISNKIRENDLSRQQNDNWTIAKAKIKERFGNDSLSYKQHIEDLGISEEYANDLARNNPKLLFKALGLDQRRQDSFETPLRNNQRQDNFSPSNNANRTWSYYQEMKKSNRKLYDDPKTTVQMHKDAIALGDAFKDGDFNR